MKNIGLTIRKLIPEPIKDILSYVNQHLFARKTIQKKLGSWFIVDFRKIYKNFTSDDWIKVYDDFWKISNNDCVAETDSKIIKQHLEIGEKILEIGCGAGLLAIDLAKSGYLVTAVDISTEALKKAKSNAASENVNLVFEQGFAENLPFQDKCFDSIVCCHTLEHVSDLEKSLAEFKRVAKNKIIILVPKQKFRLYAEHYHTYFFTKKEDIVKAVNLEKFEAFELNNFDSESDYKNKVLLYIGYL